MIRFCNTLNWVIVVIFSSLSVFNYLTLRVERIVVVVVVVVAAVVVP